MVSHAGIHKYAKYLLLEFTESTSSYEVLLHPVKVGVWCCVSARIVVPVFFNRTVNYERYVQAILGQFCPQLTEEERLCGWFQ
jgi:hypothetical protein